MKKVLLTILSFLTISIFLPSLTGCSGCGKQEHHHDYSVKNADPSYLHNQATCTNKESYYYSCTCGEKGSKTFEVGALANHSYITSVVETTCLERGYTTYACKSCEYSYTDNYVDATGHSYTEQNTNSKYLKSYATCTSKAVYYYSCACGEKGVETFESGSMIDHSYDAVVTAPTCTEKGYTTYICSVCNDSYLDDYTAALDHSFTHFVTEPTCTAQGYTTYTCTSCGDSCIDDHIDAVGHIDDGMGICTVCGLNFAPHIHSYIEKNVDSAYLKTSATCTSEAVYYYSCVCGEKGTETFENGSTLEHSHASVVTEPTCTEQGYTTYTCSRCGDSYVGSYVEATGHIYNVQNTAPRCLVSEATCSSPAIYYYSCSCYAIGTETFGYGSPKHGATTVKYEYVDDTYHITNVICKSCNSVISSKQHSHVYDPFTRSCIDCNATRGS